MVIERMFEICRVLKVLLVVDTRRLLCVWVDLCLGVVQRVNAWLREEGIAKCIQARLNRVLRLQLPTCQSCAASLKEQGAPYLLLG